MPSTTSPHTRRARHDGWTPARQRAFLDHLRDGIDVRRAAARLEMSPRSAYHLRNRDEGFAQAWDAARREARDEQGRRLIADLVERAPWARAVFPEAARERAGFFSRTV